MVSGIDAAIKSIQEKYDLDEKPEKEEKWEVWDWMNESYQLMCREYRQSLGLVNMQNYESKYQTESERKYWSELHRVRGYGEYHSKRHVDGQEVIVEVISDPPRDWATEWVQKNNIKLSPAPSPAPETEEEYANRLSVWTERINFGNRRILQ